ncbi:hypothetical protein QUF61_02065 [Candidatus Venteria ishoeyi]|uniref:LYR motif-containing protein n=1 Tax=Candidatus Venteria ishoeyi TaxID=1899563 RepID=UPI0025A63928|nr:hypothetical protein [Candidatus Venteria ishoeyi]MDM8545258.1 hypothetical protein [Candidatus Venteria ishoeyi]
MPIRFWILFCIVSCFGHFVQAETEFEPQDWENASGEVRVPLDVYRKLLKLAENPPQAAPASYAIGKAQIDMRIRSENQRSHAHINIHFQVQSFVDEWTLIPFLPASTALAQASVNGQPVQLVRTSAGFSWAVQKADTYAVQLEYKLDALASKQGLVLAAPLPKAPASHLSMIFEETDVVASVIPAVNIHTENKARETHVSAEIPAANALQIAWKAPLQQDYVLSRAHYQGEQEGDALRWAARFNVEVFTDDPIHLPLFPREVTLTEVLVNDEKAMLLLKAAESKNPGKGQQVLAITRQAHFATLLQGAGSYEIKVYFEVPIQKNQGSPNATLLVPEVPVSFFELSLPGKKQVQVTPSATVTLEHSEAESASSEATEDEGETVASVYIPMRTQVTFSWTEAVPTEIKDELRANASLYHAVHAEEGVLHGQAFVLYQVTRGETNILELEVPANTQINQISTKIGKVTDWRMLEDAVDKTGSQSQQRQNVRIFLDRKVKGKFHFKVNYEYLLSGKPENFQVPLLRAVDVHRQRGMLALLSGPELALKPLQTERLSRVGENQLPTHVRKALKMAVAHTYKYSGNKPLLMAQAITPERKRGKFDVRTDTLISIGDVTLKGAATLELNIKSGSVMDLNLWLPQDVNVLALNSPALRTYQINNEADKQKLHVEFTQEIEGQFRLELNYEVILAEGSEENSVPLVSVTDAEVEYGRIAVEALAAVEVQASSLVQLSSLDLNELPQQLVLKTTNPILLAYRYVRADTPYRLGLKITRHKELDVQVAAIEKAAYHTLLTRDGLSVTTARYTIRNSRKQFLRLQLPPDAEVWSVFVGGKSEKPAEAEEPAVSNANRRSVLIKMINSTAGFPLEVIYASKLEALGQSGAIYSVLPRPDMIVTHSRWDLYLPDKLDYQEPDSNMDRLAVGRLVAAKSIQTAMQLRKQNSNQQQGLHLQVPKRGIHFAFEKLYANQAKEDTWIEIPYVAAEAQDRGLWISLLGSFLVLLGLLAMLGKVPDISEKIGVILLITGLLLLLYAFVQLYAPWLPALIFSTIWLMIWAAYVWKSSRSG